MQSKRSESMSSNTPTLGSKVTLPCSQWSFCRRGFLSPGVQKDEEERTGSLGHLAAWEDEEPKRRDSDNESSTLSLTIVLTLVHEIRSS